MDNAAPITALAERIKKLEADFRQAEANMNYVGGRLDEAREIYARLTAPAPVEATDGRNDNS